LLNPPYIKSSLRSSAVYNQSLILAKLDSYNQRLAALDSLQNDVAASEADLRDTNKRMLSAAEAHYGSDSNEYEQVGGTRVSDRKRPVRKTLAKSEG
jgi:predicted  nucleic acid-binding Zn-ribbon protein